MKIYDDDVYLTLMQINIWKIQDNGLHNIWPSDQFYFPLGITLIFFPVLDHINFDKESKIQFIFC